MFDGLIDYLFVCNITIIFTFYGNQSFNSNLLALSLLMFMAFLSLHPTLEILVLVSMANQIQSIKFNNFSIVTLDKL